MDVLERLKQRVSAQDAVLEEALQDAQDTIFDITKRSKLTNRMESLQVSLAAEYVYRIKKAGEDSRNEGDVSVSYSKEVPEDLQKRILAFRLLKAAEVANGIKE